MNRISQETWFYSSIVLVAMHFFFQTGHGLNVWTKIGRPKLRRRRREFTMLRKKISETFRNHHCSYTNIWFKTETTLKTCFSRTAIRLQSIWSWCLCVFQMPKFGWKYVVFTILSNLFTFFFFYMFPQVFHSLRKAPRNCYICALQTPIEREKRPKKCSGNDDREGDFIRRCGSDSPQSLWCVYHQGVWLTRKSHRSGKTIVFFPNDLNKFKEGRIL